MVLPLIGAGLAAAGEALGAWGVGSTVAGLADDIPAIASMIMKHGEAQDEPPEQQAQREQQIVAKRDELVARLVKSGMPPEQATKQVNDQLAPAIQQAKQRSEGDAAAQGDGMNWGKVAGAAVGLLPGLGALRGGMGAAKAAYAAASAGPAVFGKVGQVAKGLGAGQWSLMKSGVMGAPKEAMGPGEQAALNHLKGQPPQAPPNMAGQMEQTGQGMGPNFTMASAERGRGLPYTPQDQAIVPEVMTPQELQGMAPPNAAGQMERTGFRREPNFTRSPAERGRGLPYAPPLADPGQEELMRRTALARLTPEQLNGRAGPDSAAKLAQARYDADVAAVNEKADREGWSREKRFRMMPRAWND